MQLSAFGDELAVEFDEQLAILAKHGIGLLDLRGAWGRPLLDLSARELASIRPALERSGITVSCVATPVGKSPIDGDLDFELDRLRRCIDIADALDVQA